VPRPDLSALTWPRRTERLVLRRIGLRLESTSVATSLGKDGTWLDDNTWALLREEWRG
jgi:RimJ/RimL family protein N-acetyltransferase